MSDSIERPSRSIGENQEIQIGFGKVRDFIEGTRNTNETRDLTVFIGEQSFPIRVVDKSGNLRLAFKPAWASEIEVKSVDELRKKIAEEYEVPVEDVDALEVLVEIQDLNAAINEALRSEVDSLGAQNEDLQNELAEVRERSEQERRMAEQQIAELEALIAAMEADSVEIGEVIEESRPDPDGVTIDSLGVMRRRFIDPAYQKEIKEFDRTDFLESAKNTLVLLEKAFTWDDDRGWDGESQPENLKATGWRLRLPIGYTAEVKREVVTGVMPDLAEDIKSIPMANVLKLHLNISERAKETDGKGRALAEARLIMGELMRMNRTNEPTDFFLTATGRKRSGGLEAARIEFSVSMKTGGKNQEVINYSLPTYKTAELKELFDKE